MIEQRYVKKRKRRRLVAVLSTFATMGMGSLILVSFLGSYSGSFTVSLDTGNVKLSLGNKQNFGDGEASSYLKVDSLKPFDQMTYTALPKHEIIDNEETTYLLGENSSKTLNFFKYTFYVKNTGSIAANYLLRIKIQESTPSSDGRHLDSMLRVMLYQNDGYDMNSHNFTVYALQSETMNKDENDEVTFSEYISYSPLQAARAGIPVPGFATPFVTDNVVAEVPVRYFDQSNMNRYTVVTWIEGYDPQSGGDEAPEGASIKLGVEINAYENE